MTRSSRDLYDVIKLNEWKDQKDPLPCPIPQKRKKKSPQSVEDHIQSFIHYVHSLFLSGHYETISKVLNYPFLWKLVPAENSETFALIRHQSIDFYTVKADGSPGQSLTNSKCSKSGAKLGSQPKIERSANIKIESDANDGFKYQIGAWDDSSSLFVLVSSESKIRVFSSSGQFFSEFSLPGTTSADFIWDITYTACLVKFLSNEPTASKIAEFLVMSRSGLLHSFSINPTGNLNCSSSNNLDFTPYSPIVQAEYVESDSYMLIISHKFHTAEKDQEIPQKLSDIGILMFRSANKGCNFIATKTSVPAVGSSKMLAKKLVICPFDNSRIAVLHENSCVSLWLLPEGEIVQFYGASDLPFYNEENPKINFHNQNNAKSVIVSDLHWWSEEILVLSRPNGCIFLMKFNQETSNLDLVLDQEGSKSLWLENNSLISPLFEHTSLILEPKRRTTGALDELDQVDEEIETNFLAWLKDKLLSYLFDAQHPAIEGPKSDTKYANFDYSLLKIKSTTPSELFRKKLDSCEWGEALEIANKFDGLDKDQVYQRRWQNSEKDHKNHVLDYLDKIENLAWVYKECFGTICDEYSMQNFIIEFGLKKCGLEALIEIARSHKSLDFYEKLETDEVQINEEDTKTTDKKPDVYKGFDAKQKRKNELEIKTFYEKRLFRKWQEIRGCVELEIQASEIQDSEIQGSEKLAVQDSENKHTDQVPLPENGQAREQTTEHIFNVDELEVLRARSRLLHYQKMLDVYLDILGGKDSRYDKKYFYSVRDKSGLDWAVEIAQGANSYSFGEKYSVDWQLALRIVFERFWPEIMGSYHFVLQNISETEEPESFKSLLPSAEDSLVPIEAFDLAEFSDEVMIDLGVDWVFKKPFNQEKFTDSKLTILVQNTDSKAFYEQRALDIEEFSRRADYSKDFLKIALENGVDVNKTLWRNFQCLSLLVYQETNFVRFSELKKMAASDKVNILVSKLEPNSEFIEEFYQRLEISTNETSNDTQNLDKLGVEYFSSHKNASSEIYLQKLVLFSENLKTQASASFKEASSMLKEVVYSLDECKQFELETLENLVKLVDEFDTWRHFEIFKILRNYEMPLSLERIKFGKNDLLLARIMRGVINRITKKATILDMASKLHSKFNNNDQNLRILDGIFAKLEELDFNIDKAISGMLNDDNIDQSLLTQFFSDAKYHTDIIQNLVVESGVGFIDKAESIHDSAVTIAISRFKMFPRNQTSVEYLDFISGIKIVEKTCDWTLKIQNHYKFLRDVRMVKDRLDFIKHVVDVRIQDEHQFSELLSCGRLLGINEARLKLFLGGLIEKDGDENFGLKITLELTKDAENEELNSKEVKQVAKMCLKFHDAECARFALENADEDTILEALDTFESGRERNDSYLEQLKEFESEDPFWTTLMYSPEMDILTLSDEKLDEEIYFAALEVLGQPVRYDLKPIEAIILANETPDSDISSKFTKLMRERQERAACNLLKSYGTDPARVMDDAEYRKETVIALACEGQEQNKLALALSELYGTEVSNYDLNKARLEGIFLDSEFIVESELDNLMKRFSEEENVKIMSFVEQKIFPQIEGTKYEKIRFTGEFCGVELVGLEKLEEFDFEYESESKIDFHVYSEDKSKSILPMLNRDNFEQFIKFAPELQNSIVNFLLQNNPSEFDYLTFLTKSGLVDYLNDNPELDLPIDVLKALQKSHTNLSKIDKMIDINHIESVLYNMDDIDDMYVVQLLPQLRNDTLELSDLVTLYKKQRFEAVTDVFRKFLEPKFKDLLTLVVKDYTSTDLMKIVDKNSDAVDYKWLEQLISVEIEDKGVRLNLLKSLGKYDSTIAQNFQKDKLSSIVEKFSFEFDLKNEKLITQSDRSNLFGNLVGQISCLEDVKICLEIVEYWNTEKNEVTESDWECLFMEWLSYEEEGIHTFMTFIVPKFPDFNYKAWTDVIDWLTQMDEGVAALGVKLLNIHANPENTEPRLKNDDGREVNDENSAATINLSNNSKYVLDTRISRILACEYPELCVRLMIEDQCNNSKIMNAVIVECDREGVSKVCKGLASAGMKEMADIIHEEWKDEHPDAVNVASNVIGGMLGGFGGMFGKR